MTNETHKPKMRLIFQGSVPVEFVIEGEVLYKQLKEMLEAYSDNITCGGQIVKMLEPCCPPPQNLAKTTNDKDVIPGMHQGVVDPESRDYR